MTPAVTSLCFILVLTVCLESDHGLHSQFTWSLTRARHTFLVCCVLIVCQPIFLSRYRREPARRVGAIGLQSSGLYNVSMEFLGSLFS
jgi:hypothetical protein